MPEKAREQFEKLYQQDFVLPDALKTEYEVLSCIKYTEQKQLYLLFQQSTGTKVVLKHGCGMYRDILREEAERLEGTTEGKLSCEGVCGR